MPRTGIGFARCWDAEWEPVSGCRPLSPGCDRCYAAALAGTLHQRAGSRGVVRPLYAGITHAGQGQLTYNGMLKALPPGHPSWTWPLRWRGARCPVLGPGAPSLIFVGSMADLFLPSRPREIIDDVIRTVALSPHIALLVNKSVRAMTAYFRMVPHELRQRWMQKIWTGFSAEDQVWFDKRWRHVRQLAGAGWTIPAFLAPLIGPVTLPEDFLALGNRGWVVIGGEQPTSDSAPRDVDPDWARAVVAQCLAWQVPVYVLHLSRQRIPPDLKVRQFPRVGSFLPRKSPTYSDFFAGIVRL